MKKLFTIFSFALLALGLKAQVTVVATAGNTGPTVYPDLNSAFVAINAGTHQGIIGIGISASTTETGPCVLNSSGAGSALYTAITISPVTDGVSVSAATTTGRGVIELKGADNVTIDGDNPNSAGINRNLSIINTAASTITFTSCVRIATAATVVTSADNITVKNCILTGNGTGLNNSSNTTTGGAWNNTFGIYVGGNGGTTATDAPTAISNVTSQTVATGATVNTFLADNNAINSCGRAIAFNGTATTSSTGVTVSNNTIGTAAVLTTYPFTTPANTVYSKGIWINGTNAVSITGNTLNNILSYINTTLTGIELVGAIGSGTINIANNSITAVTNNNTQSSSLAKGIVITSAGGPYTISGNTVSTIQDNSSNSLSGIEVTTGATSAVIQNNKVSGVYARSTGGYGAFGIHLNGGDAVTVRNNFIYDINSVDNNSATSTLGSFGIRVNGGINHKIYYNSIHIFGPPLAGGSAAEPSADLIVTSSSYTGLDIRNNIFSNTRTGSFSGSANVAIDLPSSLTSSSAYTINNNVYYVPTGTNSYLAILSSGTTYTVANFNPATITPATNFRSFTTTLGTASNDNLSLASTAAAPYVSNTDLHINNLAVNAADEDGKAAVIAGITTDIDGTTRSATIPDIGANEFLLPTCSAANGGTISPATVTTCAGQTTTLTSTGATTGTGITYQWMTSATSGGPYSNVVGGTGATTTSYTTGTLAAGTYYFVLQTTCTAGPMTGLSNEVAVTVNPSPTVTVTPTSSTICVPGGSPVTLTASGASTYTWSPTTGLTPTTGSPVSANPSATTIYTVTGTAANGCTATATATVTLSDVPSIIATTATPSSVCSGGTSNLLSTAATTSTYTVTNIPYAPIPTPGVGVTVLANGGTAVTTQTNSSLDDGDWENLSFPFPVTFFGASYTAFTVSTNGFIALGPGAPTTYTGLSNTFPNTASAHPSIGAVYADFDLRTMGTINYFVTGTAPNRAFVINWSGAQFYNGSGSVTTQIIIYETSNIIEVHTGNMTSHSAVEGIQDAAGTTAFTVTGRNNVTFSVSTPDAYRFAPNGGPLTYSWSPATFLNNPAISNPTASGITATTSYTVTVSNAGCTNTGSVTITAGSPLTGAATITPGSTVCAGTNITLNATPTGGGGPYTYSWTGPNSFTSTSQNPTINGVTTAMAGNYVVTITDACTATTSATATLTVNPSPAVAVTPTTGTICLPGGSPVTLTASGATTYSWTPTTALTPTTGSPVSANPTVTTIYTVTGTDGNGCVATATATVNVANTPTLTATATPSSVCLNGNSQLLATASSTNYVQTAVPFAPIASGTGTTTLANGGTATTTLTTGSLDDGYWNGLTLPFAFTYYGTSYSAISVQTNGAVSFSPFTTTTGYGSSPQLPNTADPNNMIAGCFGDMDWRFGGVISTYTSGSAPNRIFVIDYNGTGGGGFYNSGLTPTALVNMQIQLFEGTNIIQVHSTLIGGTTGSNHTQGIENATGNAATVVTGRDNTSTWTLANDGVQFAPALITYTWTPGTFLNSTTISNPLASGVTATTSYTVTASTLGCPVTASVTVTAGSLLTSTTSITPSNTVCAGTNITLNGTPAGGGSPYTYGWTGPNSFTSTSQNPTINGVTVAMSGNYVLTVTDACSATSTTTVTLTVNPLPTVAVTPTTALYCNPGTPVSLTASGATSYAWGPAAGLSATTGSNVDATPAITTTYTVTGTDGNGCVATATTAITSAPAVTGVTVSASPATICIGSATNLSSSAAPYTITVLSEDFNAGAPTWTRINNSTGGTPANAAWTDRPDGFVYASGTPYHSNDNTQFVQTNSDAQGSGSTTNTILSSPAFSTTGLGNVNLDFYQYYRDINDNGDSAVVEASLDNITWTIITAYTATSGVENGFTHPVVTLPPAYNNQPSVYVRFRFTATWDWYWSIDNVSITAGSSAYTYNWSSAPVGFTSTTQNPTGVMPTTTTSYSVTLTNPFGCTGTGSTTVTVNPTPTVTATASTTTVCAGSPSTLTGSGASTYLWNPGALVGTTVTVNPTVTTTYTVTGTNTSGCTDTATVTINVNPLPVVTLSGNSSFCAGGNTALTGTSGVSHQWYQNGVLITGATNNTYTATTGGVYNMVMTNGNGCSDSASTGITVTVNPIPVLAPTAAAPSICVGDSSILNASGATAYAWNPGALIGSSVTVMPSSTATYTVTGVSAAGCTGVDSVTVTVNPLPVVTLGADVTQCGGTVLLDAGNAGSTYLWNDNTTAQTLNAAATGPYSVTVTSAAGCSGSDTINVMINALPVVNLGADVAQCGGSVTLDAGAAAHVGYLWNDNTTQQTLVASSTNNYSVTVLDSITGCSNADTVLVTINTIPVVNLGSDVVQCGGTVTLDAGNPGAAYLWSNSTTQQTLVVSASNSYSVTVTDQTTGCSNSDSVNVTINALPTVTFSIAQTIICKDDAVLTLSGTPAGGTFTGTSVTGNTFNPLTAGTGVHAITYTYTDATTGCSNSVSDSLTVSNCVGIDTPTGTAFDVSVYPNPNNGVFTVNISNMSADQARMEIFSVDGKLIYSEDIAGVTKGFSKEISLSTFANGAYFLKVNSGSEVKTIKVFKQD